MVNCCAQVTRLSAMARPPPQLSQTPQTQAYLMTQAPHLLLMKRRKEVPALKVIHMPCAFTSHFCFQPVIARLYIHYVLRLSPQISYLPDEKKTKVLCR